MELNVSRVHTAILFSILFVSIGWVAPAAYASYAPESQYIEVNGFHAEDATTADGEHVVCFDRNVKRGTSATVFTELYLISEDGKERIEVDSNIQERYFQKGNYAVETRLNLPDHAQAGDYRYVLVVQMDLAQGRVEREFTYMSDTFTITESNNTTSQSTTKFSC